MRCARYTHLRGLWLTIADFFLRGQGSKFMTCCKNRFHGLNLTELSFNLYKQSYIHFQLMIKPENGQNFAEKPANFNQKNWNLPLPEARRLGVLNSADRWRGFKKLNDRGFSPTATCTSLIYLYINCLATIIIRWVTHWLDKLFAHCLNQIHRVSNGKQTLLTDFRFCSSVFNQDLSAR